MRSDKKRPADYNGMRETLFGSLSEIGVIPDHERIKFYWNLTVGPEIAEVSRVQRLEGTTLYIHVADECWKKALIPLEKQILNQMNRQNSRIHISKIEMKESKKTFPIHEETRNPFQTPEKPLTSPMEIPKIGILATVEEPELRQKLNRLENKFRFSSLVWVLFCWSFIANCSTSQSITLTEPIDLDNAYSVKEIEQLNKKNPQNNFKDPRAYFHFLMEEQVNIWE